MAEVLDIEVESGTYQVRKPGGALGVMFMGLMTETAMQMQRNTGHIADPDSNEDPEVFKRLQQLDVIQDEAAELQALTTTFKTFATDILPHIVVGGPNKYEDMPGEDQFGIYLALMRASKSKPAPFRILTPKYAEVVGKDGSAAAHPTVDPGRLD